MDLHEQAPLVEDVLKDIMALRHSINSLNRVKNDRERGPAWKAHWYLQIVALVLCVVTLAGEVASGQFIYESLTTKNSGLNDKLFHIVAIGAFLILATINLYFAIAKAARKSEENFETYTRRHFQYVQNLSHISDLAIKYAVISALILGNKGEWVSPFLFLFTADYLFQGRLFTLPLKSSAILAVMCAAAGGTQFYFENAQLIWPLAGFAIVNLISLVNLKIRRAESAR